MKIVESRFEATGVPGEFPGFGLPVVGLIGPEVSVEVAPQNDDGDPSCSGVMKRDGSRLGTAACRPRVIH